MNKEVSNLKKELENGRSVLVFTSGTSMEPLLYDKSRKNATHVLVEPTDGVLTRGDLPFILLPDGRYMIHRILGVKEEQGKPYYITRGDNCICCEKVEAGQVLGRVSQIYRKDRTIRVTDKGYLLYAHAWMLLYPVRRAVRSIVALGAKIMRKCR